MPLETGNASDPYAGWKTFDGWKKKGMVVRRGEHGRRAGTRYLFAPHQVVLCGARSVPRNAGVPLHEDWGG